MFLSNLPSLSSESISLIESKQSLLVSTSISCSTQVSNIAQSGSSWRGAGASTSSQSPKISSHSGSDAQSPKISQSWGLACRSGTRSRRRREAKRSMFGRMVDNWSTATGQTGQCRPSGCLVLGTTGQGSQSGRKKPVRPLGVKSRSSLSHRETISQLVFWLYHAWALWQLFLIHLNLTYTPGNC